jgi:hypothetical protein
MDPKKELSNLEDSRCAAMIHADGDALSRLLDDDLVWTHSSARLDTKASFLQGLKEGGTRYLTINRSEETIRVHGNLAVITGIADLQAVLKGEQRQLRNRYTNIWVKRDGAWKMVAWQSTAVPQ